MKPAKDRSPEAVTRTRKAISKRHRADLQQPEHEQHRQAGGERHPLAQDHHRAAEAHHLPGDQEATGVLQPEHAERAEQARRGTEQPCRPPLGHRRGERHGAGGGRQAEAHQPKPFRRDGKAEPLAGHAERQRDGRRAPRQRHDRGGDGGERADPERGAHHADAAPRQRQRAARRPQERRQGEQLIRHGGLRARVAARDPGTVSSASMIAAGLGGQPGR